MLGKARIISLWKSGSWGKAIVIMCAVLVLRTCSCLFVAEKPTIEFSELSTEMFTDIFLSSDCGSENGVVYKHVVSPSVQVISVDDDGVLVAYVRGCMPFLDGIENFLASFGGSMDEVVFIQTDRADEYTNGMSLKDGYYLRDGTCSYVSVMDSRETVARFVELSDRASIEKCHELERLRTERESADALSAEGASLDVDVPIKSLCGFVVGSTPSKSWKLFTENQNVPFRHTRDMACHYKMRGTLVKPFRMFTQGCAEYTFYDGVPERLYSIRLRTETTEKNNTTHGEYVSELMKVRDLIQDKLGIKLSKIDEDRNHVTYRWGSGANENGVSDESVSLWLDYDTMYLELYCHKVCDICKRERELSRAHLNIPDQE